ncbi:MAG: phage integrase SAM-like domain-containing protein [Phycisphaerae bacterium]|nr:phage integrase SAM-like domain-containing protein [Phycisphaerae bacterium]
MASLTRIGGGKTPIRAIDFFNGEGKRRRIRLGRVGRDSALEFKRQLEKLQEAQSLGNPLDPKLAEWVAGLPDKTHEKLAREGLVSPRHGMGLGQWLTKYIEQRRSELKPSTLTSLGLTEAKLKAYFGDDKPIDRITVNDAVDWRAWLLKQPRTNGGEGETLSEAYVRQQCRNAKRLFGEAEERGLIPKSPFRTKLIKTGAISANRDRYVTPEEADKVVEACPDVEWKLIVGLARFAGLRCPSETHILTWLDVDWDGARLTVRSPKTERFQDKAERIVPITPKLMAILQDAFEAAPEGRTKIITRSRRNLHRGLDVIVRRAGLKPWPACYQTLRASCDTEWSMLHPEYAVAYWLGHSTMVSRKHYKSVPDELYTRAAGVVPEAVAGRGESAAERAAVDGSAGV